VLDLDTLMAAITGAEGQHSRDIGRDLPLKTAVLHKRRCSTSVVEVIQRWDRHQGGVQLDRFWHDYILIIVSLYIVGSVVHTGR